MRIFLIFFCLTMTVTKAITQLDSLITFSGSIDVYFRQNINSTNDASNGGTLAPATSFANLPGFAMGMANLKIGYTKEKVNVLGDFVFGPRGKEAVFKSPAGLNIINQLYIGYQYNTKLSFTIGKYNTFIGYEYISPIANVHYSTSYMFSNGPFNHTGIKANYNLGKGFIVMASVMNPTDFTDFNPTNKYFEGLQLSYAKDKTSLFFNGLLTRGFQQYDITGTQKISSKYTLGLNITTATDAFNGIAIYSTYGISKKIDVSARVEYFEDKGVEILEGTNASAVDATISFAFKTPDFRIVPEFRIDLYESDEKYKPIIKDAKTQERTNNLSSFVLAAIANF
jgi:hypothetical protein